MDNFVLDVEVSAFYDWDYVGYLRDHGHKGVQIETKIVQPLL